MHHSIHSANVYLYNGSDEEYILIWTLNFKVIKRNISILILFLVRAGIVDSMAIGTTVHKVEDKSLRN